MSHPDSDPTGPRSEDAAPEDVSNQNREEPSAPHQGADGNPGASEQADRVHPPDSERSSQHHAGTEGGAGESSQATGNPKNAG